MVSDWQTRKRSRYIFAISALVLAALFHFFLERWLKGTAAYVTFWPAVVVSSWYGGLGPGLLVTGLAAIAFQFGFAPGWLDQIFLVVMAVLFSVLNEQRLRSVATLTHDLYLSHERLEDLQLETGVRQQTERREAEQYRWAFNTLSSIGDGVICTDGDARITFMNRSAEQLTGWMLKDAANQPVSEVFKVVDAVTRKPVPNPIFDALREGDAQGWCSNSLLVSQQGRELPVDDSAAPIRNQNQEIIGAVLVFRDVSEQRDLEEALLRANRQLARSNSDLGNFAHMISHDLQEPLRVMTLYSELLKRRSTTQLGPLALEWVDHIESSAKRLSRMIENLLMYSKISDTNSHSVKTVRLSEIAQQAQQNLAGSIRETGATVCVGMLPTVQGDGIQLLQVFQNLISNAIKYHDEEAPVVEIAAEESDTHWTVRIRDNGVGVEPAQRKRIFELFARASLKADGTGVGLATCKRIIERHGGEIWVDPHPERGSIFSFTLSKNLDHLQ